MTNKQEFWVNKTIEECGEVITALCKLRNYGPQTNGFNNQSDVETEIGDLEYCLDQLKDALNLDLGHIFNSYNEKENKISKYIGFSRLIDPDRDIKVANRLQKVNDEEFDMDGRC